ncbi:MAG: hypothetical protein ACYTGH_04680 [Planctomycetota bacterium]|jgi:hypothetical protein
MAFVKNWWLWIAMGVVLLVLALIQLLVTSGYEEEAAKGDDILKTRQKKIAKMVKDIGSRNVATKGDLDAVETHLSAIRGKGKAAVTEWFKSSAAMNEPHGKDPKYEYNNFLFDDCEKNARDLTLELLPFLIKAEPRLLGSALAAETDDELLEKIAKRVGDKKWTLCDLETAKKSHQLADLEARFTTVDETLPTWNRYLILRRLQEVIKELRVTVKTKKLVDPKKTEGEGEEEAETSDASIFEDVKQVRVVERLGTVEWGEVRPASFISVEKKDDDSSDDDSSDEGGEGDSDGNTMRGEVTPKVTYHDAHPVTFEVVGHVKVVQALMKALLEAGGEGVENSMLFVPKGMTLKRFTPEETRPKQGSLAKDTTAEKKHRLVPIALGLEYTHEPPVQATLSYEVYHYRYASLTPDAEGEGNGEN